VKYLKKEIDIAGKRFTIELGALAKQANGSCIVRVGDTIILATATTELDTDIDTEFLPLTVDYRERAYAAGKIPGGFFKRENKPKDSEILVSRIIDRSIRPIFTKSWRHTTQITVIVLSYDGENDPVSASVLGTSIALYTSNIPFNIPISSVRIGKIGEQYVINPSLSEQKSSQLNLIVSGTSDSLTMVEASSLELSEIHIINALDTACKTIKQICLFQKELCINDKIIVPEYNIQNVIILKDIIHDINNNVTSNIIKKNKKIREALWTNIKRDISSRIIHKYPEEQLKLINSTIEEVFNKAIRNFIIKNKIRMDGRQLDEIRNITCQNGILPRVHGSCLFTRGETQALATVTLGTLMDRQVLDELYGECRDRFMLHYNFPGFATGEPKSDKALSRREIGHGYLAKRAIAPILPNEHDFAYTIRIVSDILESNGSSSMASVCGASLALINAGVPIIANCAGIAMGLIKEDSKYVILTDIMGVEDYLGDMDFKITGTKHGITALQMDIKNLDIDISIISNAIKQAKQKLLEILDIMDSSITVTNHTISAFAPAISVLNISQAKIGELIGPGGRNIRKLQEDHNVKIDIDKNGRVFISGMNSQCVNLVKKHIEAFNVELKIGLVYDGIVIKLVEFGIFVEIIPGKIGLVHISQYKKGIKRLNKGDKVRVKIINIDRYGKIGLQLQLK
jgi:polyribonucleotide nucleotidyltransferase